MLARMRSTRRPALALFLLTLAGCTPAESRTDDGGAAEPDATTPTPGDASTTTDDAATSGECGASDAGRGLFDVETTVGGETRSYGVLVPAGLDGSTRPALVIAFHGLGGNGRQIRAYLGLEEQAGADAIHVYPDGLPRDAAGGRTAWDSADLALFDAIVADVSARYCVDPQRIFVVGHSYGAYMTNLVGCARGDVVAGIAPVSGGAFGSGCRGAVPAWIAHGTSDATVPESEGVAAREAWRMRNGCGETETPVSPSPCVAYDCADAPVQWCAFDGGHFPLPSFTRDAIWSFFTGL